MPDLKAIAKELSGDEGLWSDLKYAADENGEELEAVVAEIAEVMEEPWLVEQADDDAERLAHAARIKLSRLMQGMLSSAEAYEVYVLDVTEPREITLTDKETGEKEQVQLASVYGVGSPEDGELAYVDLTLWRDKAALASEVKRGVEYTVRAGGGLQDGIYDLNSADATTFKRNDDQPDLDPIEVVQELFPVVPVSELGANVSTSRSDLKLVYGNVIYATVRQGRTGKVFGRYLISDRSVSAQSVKDGAAISVMVDPGQVRCGEGSSIYVLGTVDDSEEYGLGMRGSVVLPEIATPAPERPVPADAAPAEDVELGETEDDEDAIDFSSFE